MATPFRLTFQLAGFCARISVPKGALADALAARFTAFRSRRPTDLDLTITAAAGHGQVAGPQRPVPAVGRGRGGVLHVRGADFEGTLRGAHAQARVAADGLFGVECVLRVALGQWLLARGGLLLHAVAAARNGRGLVFTGPSGAGKSTLGALLQSRGWALLGDELVALARDGQALRVNGTPWNIGAPGGAALKGIGLLAHGPRARLEPVRPAELVRVLIPNTFVPVPDADGRRATFAAAAEWVSRLPAYRLTFARHPGVASVLARALE